MPAAGRPRNALRLRRAGGAGTPPGAFAAVGRRPSATPRVRSDVRAGAGHQPRQPRRAWKHPEPFHAGPAAPQPDRARHEPRARAARASMRSMPRRRRRGTPSHHACATSPAALEPAAEFVQPSPYVPRLAALRELARPSFAPGRPLADAAIELMQRIHAEFRLCGAEHRCRHAAGRGPGEQRGVCQDFAHLMIGCDAFVRPAGALCQRLSADARPGGGAAMLGADASHAWLQVWCPGTPGVPADGWLDLDPTNTSFPARPRARRRRPRLRRRHAVARRHPRRRAAHPDGGRGNDGAGRAGRAVRRNGPVSCFSGLQGMKTRP